MKARNYLPIVKGHIYYGGPDPRCECGDKPPAKLNQQDARSWHREHKKEISNGNYNKVGT